MTELFHQPQNPSLKHLQNRIKARAEIVRLSNRNLIKMIKVTFLLALFAVLALAIAYPQEKTAVDADEEAASRGRYWGYRPSSGYGGYNSYNSYGGSRPSYGGYGGYGSYNSYGGYGSSGLGGYGSSGYGGYGGYRG
ncbi:uncharacterized protein LOC136033075 [Artemia franciscana]|uniref:Uncharacterized protein n=1 Tax=Artemia franciscana TaxID=6661 RepID=A0AA88IDM5_ARTSF|nr:hypothetical protein QYM36_001678 [Artemia franciscana]